MKKIIATLAVIFSLVTSATYAYDGSRASKALLQSFDKEFSGASNVSWVQISNGLYRFGFNYKGKDVQAFFTESGNLVATGSVIAADNLPLVVSKAIDSKYAGYNTTEVIEFTMDNETQYLITVSDGAKSQILKVTNNGDISIFKKLK